MAVDQADVQVHDILEPDGLIKIQVGGLSVTVTNFASGNGVYHLKGEKDTNIGRVSIKSPIGRSIAKYIRIKQDRK